MPVMSVRQTSATLSAYAALSLRLTLPQRQAKRHQGQHVKILTYAAAVSSAGKRSVDIADGMITASSYVLDPCSTAASSLSKYDRNLMPILFSTTSGGQTSELPLGPLAWMHARPLNSKQGAAHDRRVPAIWAGQLDGHCRTHRLLQIQGRSRETLLQHLHPLASLSSTREWSFYHRTSIISPFKRSVHPT